MYVFKGNSLLVTMGPDIRAAGPERADYREYAGVRVAVTTDEAPDGCEYREFIWLGDVLDSSAMGRAAYGLQMWRWDSTTRFCGRCGTENQFDRTENCKLCPQCGHRQYPAQFPVAIVAITRGDRILLAHNANFPEGLYSLIAGYADLGESIEETVRREVREEVGLEISNIRYFGSQNWAASSSLMLGFTAEWAAGEIQVDGVEIVDADWFERDKLPARLPMKDAIAAWLIADWLGKATKPAGS